MDNRISKSIITSLGKYHNNTKYSEHNEDHDTQGSVNVLINNDTKKFYNSHSNSDIIQCALEYNNYLINKIIEKKNSLSQDEYEACFNLLWKNLYELSKTVDAQLNNNFLSNSKKYCKNPIEHSTEADEKDKDIKTDNSRQRTFLGHKHKRKKPKDDHREKSSGFTIVIDKSILND